MKSKKGVLSIFYHLIAYFITLMIYIIMKGGWGRGGGAVQPSKHRSHKSARPNI